MLPITHPIPLPRARHLYEFDLLTTLNKVSVCLSFEYILRSTWSLNGPNQAKNAQ